MRRTLIAVYLHLIWATWDRLPLLEPTIERGGHRAIEAKARDLGTEFLGIGGTEDHVHVLVGIPATLSIATLVHDLKGASAHLVTHELAPHDFFKWQGAYAAFSISPRLLNQAKDYGSRQREHHAAHDSAIAWERQVFDRLWHESSNSPSSTT